MALRIISIIIVLAALIGGYYALQSVADGQAEAAPTAIVTSHTAEDGASVPAVDVEAIKQANLFDDILPMDVVYGNPSAPVKIIEYASLSCSHCKAFHEEVLGELKKEYVESGKVSVVYRHYPLNLPALRAAQLVSCVENPQVRKDFISVLFKTQADWAFSKNEEDFVGNLEKLWDVAGLDRTAYQSCIEDKPLEEALLVNHMRATKELEVESTPAIFVNGKKYTESRRADALSAYLDTLLAQ